MNTSEWKTVLAEQRAELSSLRERARVAREVEPHFRPLLSSRLVKVIIGPRRSGKSSLALRLLAGEEFAYVNFDDESLSAIRPDDLRGLMEAVYAVYGKRRFLFLDEIQNVPGWELFANRLTRQGHNLIVTGSNANLLSRELATHLTGRHRLLELHPFSFREFLAHRGLSWGESLTAAETAEVKNALDDYLQKGGFPESYSEPFPRRYLTDLYHAVLTNDIALRHDIRRLGTIRDLATYLLSHPACRMSHTKLKNIFSLKSVPTVQNYVLYLEEAFLVVPLDRFSFKFKERVTAPRKMFGIDPGLIRAVSGAGNNDRGRLLETVVFLDLIRRRSWKEGGEGVFYWQAPTGEEVDFVLSRGRRASSLIQVCSDVRDPETRAREVRSLLKGAEALRCKDLTILTPDIDNVEKIAGETIHWRPVWKWLLEGGPGPA
jgi:uncharacterized protein